MNTHRVATKLGALVLILVSTWGSAAQALTPQDAYSANLTASDSNLGIQNTELIVANLAPNGLPLSATLYDTVTIAQSQTEITLTNPTSIQEIAYVNQRGTPVSNSDGAEITLSPEQKSVTTQAKFGKPLPIALHAQYLKLGESLEPDTVAGLSGDLTLRYTITNTTAQLTPISYTLADGSTTSTELPVFAPYVGTLQLAFPAGTSVRSAPGAVLTSNAAGGTVATWQLVLFPPLGDYQQKLAIDISGTELKIPELTMQVAPVTASQDPAVAFAADLLQGSTDGSTELANGLSQLDGATMQLANGVGQLTSGLQALAGGSATLTTGLESGTDATNQLSQGANTLTAGLTQISAGLATLSGNGGTVQVQEQLVAMSSGVQQLAALVGSPDDPVPPGGEPTTLYQLATAAEAGAASLDNEVTRAITRISAVAVAQIEAAIAKLQDLQATLETAVADAEAAYAEICEVTSPPAGCQSLRKLLDIVELGVTQIDRLITEIEKVGATTAEVLEQLGLISVAGQQLASAMQAMQTGLAKVNTALVGGSPGTPGISEGLILLANGVGQLTIALTQASTGTQGAAIGAEQLATGSEQLAQGIGDAASGSATLTTGLAAAEQAAATLSTGAKALSTQGTSEIYQQVVTASREPALAASYLQATELRITEAMPYGAPTGASGRAAYLYTMTAAPTSQNVNWVVLGAAVLILGALIAVSAQKIARESPAQQATTEKLDSPQ